MAEETAMADALREAGVKNKKRQSDRTSAEAARGALDVLQVNPSKLARMIGASESSMHRWIADDDMPVFAAMACECLILRAGKRAKSDRVQVLVLRDGAVAQVTWILDTDRMQAGGKSFWLVPIVPPKA